MVQKTVARSSLSVQSLGRFALYTHAQPLATSLLVALIYFLPSLIGSRPVRPVPPLVKSYLLTKKTSPRFVCHQLKRFLNFLKKVHASGFAYRGFFYRKVLKLQLLNWTRQTNQFASRNQWMVNYPDSRAQ